MLGWFAYCIQPGLELLCAAYAQCCGYNGSWLQIQCPLRPTIVSAARTRAQLPQHCSWVSRAVHNAAGAAGGSSRTCSVQSAMCCSRAAAAACSASDCCLNCETCATRLAHSSCGRKAAAECMDRQQTAQSREAHQGCRRWQATFTSIAAVDGSRSTSLKASEQHTMKG
jgi:hypothetical protein